MLVQDIHDILVVVDGLVALPERTETTGPSVRGLICICSRFTVSLVRSRTGSVKKEHRLMFC